MMTSRPWFERFPELESWELERFAHHGLPITLDQGRRAAGQLVVTTSVTYGDAPLQLTVRYPSEYPELPPVVYGPVGLLDRHQHAFGGNFCLLERPIDDWKARDWGAADLIVVQLADLLADTTAGPETVRLHEAPMPEPVTAFYTYARDAAVVIPGELSTPAGDRGKLRIGRVTKHLHVLTAIDERLANPGDAFPLETTLTGSWLRLPQPPLVGSGDGPSLVRWLREVHPNVLSKPLPKAWVKQGRAKPQPVVECVGLVFAEEGPGVGETRDAWLFLFVDRSNGGERAHLLHAQVLSREERQRRIPDLAGLAHRRVLVLGAGSMGGDVAIELARSGVGRIDILDFDRFEVTNSVRHPLGVDYTALPKNVAVALACRRANPFCDVDAPHVRFGVDDWDQGEAPADVLADLLANADLLVEATGSHQIAQFASRLCAEAGVPMISGWMTDGFYGAEIVRIRPGLTMCWTCFATAHREGRLPTADQGPDRPVVVQGCSHPTVEGASFDVAEAAAMFTRLAVGMLEPDGGYPDAPYNYAAISFRRAPDASETPRLATADLEETTEGCAQCNPGVGSIAVHTGS